MKIYLNIILSIFYATCLICQEVIDIAWEKPYPSEAWETINDATILPNGNLIMVGTTRQSKNGDTDGLILLVDGNNGTLIKKRPFGYAGDDVFKSVAVSAEDGSFYLVGSTEKNKQNGKKKDAWLLQLSYWGDTFEIIKEEIIGGNTDDSFEAIIWMRQAALIAGFQNKSEGTVRAFTYNNKDGFKKNVELVSGYAKDIIGLVKGKHKHYWLCGNTKKSKAANTKDGIVWYSLLDEHCNQIKSDFIGGKGWKKAHNINRGLDGSLLITGQNWWGFENADNWIYQIHDNGYETKEVSGRREMHEKGSAILQTNKGTYWVVNTISSNDNFPIQISDQEIAFWGDLEDQEPFQTDALLHLRDKFEVKKLLKTPFQTYFLIGNDYVNKKKRTAIRLLSIKNGGYLASKALAELRPSKPILLDSNNDNIMSAGEKGAIQFTLENIGNTAIPEGSIEITSPNLVNGLKYQYQKMYLDYLEPGDQQLIALPLRAQNNIGSGTSEFEFKVIVKGKKVLTISANIDSGIKKETKTQAPVQRVVMGWRKPDITQNPERKVDTKQKSYTVQVSVTTDRKLKTTDFKVRKNGVVLQDERNKPDLTNPVPEKDLFQYTFTYTVTGLTEGENRIYVELPDIALDPITINYQPTKPNLHLLAIGPTYDDLKFTAKDARDFAQLVSQQEGNGFFDKVFIDTLLTAQNTNKTAIEIQFKNLAKRAANTDYSNHIKANDYVMIFFSGHGTYRDNKFRLLPTGFQLDYPDETMVDYTAMLEKNVKTIGVKTIIFIDACLSGNAKSATSSADEALSNALIRANQSLRGITVFTSCSEEQSSYEDDSWKNGAFTKALLEGLSGQQVNLSNGDSYSIQQNKNQGTKIPFMITVPQLEHFLRVRVPDLVKHKGIQQIPMVTKKGIEEDVPIFILKN